MEIDNHLNLAVVSNNNELCDLIRSISSTTNKVKSLTRFKKLDIINEIISSNINAIMIEIYAFNVVESLKFIDIIRKEHSHISFCLILNSIQKDTFPSISEYWRKRFSHYFYILTDVDFENLIKYIKRSIDNLHIDTLGQFGITQIDIINSKLKTIIHHKPDNDQEANSIIDQLKNVKEIFNKMNQTTINNNDNLIQGISQDKFEALFFETIYKSQKSISVLTYTNLVVLSFGIAVLFISLYISVANPNWVSAFFGAMGVTSMIASLIKNPLTSIGKIGREFVHNQTAYIALIAQIRLLSANYNNNANSIECSKQLGVETERIAKILKD